MTQFSSRKWPPTSRKWPWVVSDPTTGKGDNPNNSSEGLEEGGWIILVNHSFFLSFECEGGWVEFGPYATLGQDCSKDAFANTALLSVNCWHFETSVGFSIVLHAGVCWWSGCQTFRAAKQNHRAWTGKGRGWCQGREFWELQTLEGYFRLPLNLAKLWNCLLDLKSPFEFRSLRMIDLIFAF